MKILHKYIKIDIRDLSMKLEEAKKILKDNGFEAIESVKKKVIKNNKSDFDIDAIPMEVLDRGWKRYHPYNFTITHSNPLSRRKRITEATEYLKQIQEVKKNIISTYPISEEQFLIKEGEHGLYAAILIALTDDNADIIEYAMESQGFFRSQPTNEQLLIDRKNRAWLDMRFEPKNPDDVTMDLKDKYKYVYHLVPSIKEKDIEKNGIKASNNNPMYRYSENRVFVTEGNIKNQGIQDLVDTLYLQALKKHIENLTNEYTLFKIDLSSLDNKIRFFYDINEKHGLYTKMDIPATAIVGKKHVYANSGISNL